MIPSALENNGGKDTVKFKSLPRETRDQVYDYALIQHGTISTLSNLEGDEHSTRDFNLHPAYALLSIKAFNLRIALAAREHFFSRNSFSVYDFALSDFLSGNTGHINGPGRSDIRPWITHLLIVISDLTVDLVKVEKPAKMISRFQPLQGCPLLRMVIVAMFGKERLSKHQLVHTLQSVSFSCSDLNRRLGSKLVFEVDMRYQDRGDGLRCTDDELEHSVCYEAFGEDIETMRDDRTRQRLLPAAE